MRLWNPPQLRPMAKTCIGSRNRESSSRDGSFFRMNPKTPEAPARISAPDRVLGVAFERRVEHGFDGGVLVEPFRDLDARGLVLREPHGKRSQPFQRRVTGFRGREALDRLVERLELREAFFVGRDRAEERVRLSRDVLLTE